MTLSFKEFVNEGLHTIKRKYTDAHPEKRISDYAPVRERIMSFLKEKKSATHEEMSEFFKLMNEETGRKTGISWVRANSHLVSVKESGGVRTYALTAEGLRTHKKITGRK